jgi:DNA modification methylase
VGDVQLYLGDCLEILPTLEAGSVDAVITDPPYEGYDDLYQWDVVNMSYFPNWILDLRWFCFWKNGNYPLSYSSRHIWSKANRNIGKNAEQYEEIYERNGKETGLVYRHAVIDSVMNAQLNSDQFFEHPTQKPIKLIRRLVEKISKEGDTILDPFMGSGTTGVACVQTGRNFIGIEIEPKYYEIAEKRIIEAQQQIRMPI